MKEIIDPEIREREVVSVDISISWYNQATRVNHSKTYKNEVFSLTGRDRTYNKIKEDFEKVYKLPKTKTVRGRKIVLNREYKIEVFKINHLSWQRN